MQTLRQEGREDGAARPRLAELIPCILHRPHLDLPPLEQPRIVVRGDSRAVS